MQETKEKKTIKTFKTNTQQVQDPYGKSSS